MFLLSFLSYENLLSKKGLNTVDWVNFIKKEYTYSSLLNSAADKKNKAIWDILIPIVSQNPSWVVKEHQPNTNSGFSGTMFSNVITNETVIAFRGTEFEFSIEVLRDLLTDALFWDIDLHILEDTNDTRLKIIKQFKDAWDFVKDCAQKTTGCTSLSEKEIIGFVRENNIKFTGHSLGGGIAQYLSCRTNGEAITFNAVGIGRTVNESGESAQNYPVTDYALIDDWVGSYGVQLGTTVLLGNGIYEDIVENLKISAATIRTYIEKIKSLKVDASIEELMQKSIDSLKSIFSQVKELNLSSLRDVGETHLLRNFWKSLGNADETKDIPIIYEFKKEISTEDLDIIKRIKSINAGNIENLPEIRPFPDLPTTDLTRVRLDYLGDANINLIVAPDYNPGSSSASVDDVLLGMGGNDSLYGGIGNDILVGGSGNDILYGGRPSASSVTDKNNNGNGNDIYVFGKGSGNDIIIDTDNVTGNQDTVVFDSTLTVDGVVFTRTAKGDLLISLKETQDSLTVMGFFNEKYQNGIGSDPLKKANQVEVFQFYNGETITADDIIKSKLTIYGTSKNDGIRAFGNNETIYGFEGDDAISGLSGNDTIIGSTGKDRLYGGIDNLDNALVSNGDDTYVFSKGDGSDIIYDSDSSPSNMDTIFFENISSKDVTAVRKDLDLIIFINGTTDSIKIDKYFSQQGYGWTIEKGWHYFTSTNQNINRIEKIKFSDDEWDIGRTIYQTTRMNGTGAGDIINGYETDDFIQGFGGNDTINTGEGRNIVLAGLGDDSIYAGNMGDSLVGGSGNDVIFGRYGEDLIDGGEGNDTLHGGASLDLLNPGKSNGSDFYIFRKGDGYDKVIDFDPTVNQRDIIYFQDLKREDVIFERSGIKRAIFSDFPAESFDDLIIRSKDEKNVVRIIDFFKESNVTINNSMQKKAANQIESFVFADKEMTAMDAIEEVKHLYARDANFRYVGPETDDYFDVSGYRTSVNGGGGNDTIKVMPQSVQLFIDGGDGNDTIIGGPGSNNYSGGDGDDILILNGGGGVATGGLGNDWIDTGVSKYHTRISEVNLPKGKTNGNDVFVFGEGYTAVYISDSDDTIGNHDKIVIKGNVLPNEIKITRTDELAYVDSNSTSGYDLKIELKDGSYAVVHNYFLKADNSEVRTIAADATIMPNRIEEIEFSNGHVMNEKDILDATKTIKGSEYGESIRGYEADEMFYGFGGRDIIRCGDGNDVIYGGKGDDYLSGEKGNDTYIYNKGDGWDTIGESGSSSALDMNDLLMIDTSHYDLDFYRYTPGHADMKIQITEKNNLGGIEVYQSRNSDGNLALETIKTTDGYSITNKNYEQLMSRLESMTLAEKTTWNLSVNNKTAGMKLLLDSYWNYTG